MAPNTGSLFDPEGFSAGGFFDDVDGTIIDARVDTWAEAKDKCLVILEIEKDDPNEGEEPRTEYYSIGNLDKISPSRDNSSVVYEEGTKMNGSTKWALFMKALINAGFDRSRIGDNVKEMLVGVRGHFNQIEMDIKGNSKNFKKNKKDDGKDDRKPQVLVITKLLDAKAKTASARGNKSAGAASTKTAKGETAPAANDDTSTSVEGVILGLLADGAVAARTLPSAIFGAVKGDADLRKAALKLAGDKSWLGDEARPWTYDAEGGELSL